MRGAAATWRRDSCCAHDAPLLTDRFRGGGRPKSFVLRSRGRQERHLAVPNRQPPGKRSRTPSTGCNRRAAMRQRRDDAARSSCGCRFSKAPRGLAGFADGFHWAKNDGTRQAAGSDGFDGPARRDRSWCSSYRTPRTATIVRAVALILLPKPCRIAPNRRTRAGRGRRRSPSKPVGSRRLATVRCSTCGPGGRGFEPHRSPLVKCLQIELLVCDQRGPVPGSASWKRLARAEFR
jgi:hypothetical protein